MKGLVIAKTRRHYVIEANNETFTSVIKGTLHLHNLNIVVGDKVSLDKDTKQIISLEDRKNFLLRPPVANIDQVIIVMSVDKPPFSLFLVEKFLTYCYFAEVKPLVVITKADKIDPKEEKKIKEIMAHLDGYACDYFITSIKSGVGLDKLKAAFSNKVSALMGQTGVGKSSLINALFPEFEREIGDISEKLGRGRHTTREVILLKIENGYLADTPGFSSFELPMDKEAIAQNYPLIKRYLGKCYFNNCLHLSETGCAVKKALEEGKIPPMIYQNYVKLIEETNK